MSFTLWNFGHIQNPLARGFDRNRLLCILTILSFWTLNYLDHVCEFFGIEKKRNPMGMDVPGLYVRALEGDKKALGRIREHCLDDLRATRKLYLLLGPLLQAQHTKDRGAGLAAKKE